MTVRDGVSQGQSDVYDASLNASRAVGVFAT